MEIQLNQKWNRAGYRSSLKCFLFVIGLLPVTFGSTVARAEECQIQSTQDILTCAVSHHPEVIDAQNAAKRDALLKGVARQRINPELESKIVTGQKDGGQALNTETTFFHTIETGGKRPARIKQAEAQGKLAEILVRQSKETVILNTVLSLYRLRQIHFELSELQNSILVFQHAINQFSSLPKLIPEQEVSKSSMEIALDDFKMKRVTLQEEENNLKYFLVLATGEPWVHLQKYLPPRKFSWPKLLTKTSAGEFNSSEIENAQAELNITDASVALAKGDSWPNFKFGPTLETETQNRDTNLVGGVSLSLPVPILSQNKSGRSFAVMDRIRAEERLANIQNKSRLEHEKQIRRYNTALRAIWQIRSMGDLRAKRQNIEGLFSRGLIAGNLVVESQRQILEIIQSGNEQELTALDALWQVYILEGRALREKP